MSRCGGRGRSDDPVLVGAPSSPRQDGKRYRYTMARGQDRRERPPTEDHESSLSLSSRSSSSWPTDPTSTRRSSRGEDGLPVRTWCLPRSIFNQHQVNPGGTPVAGHAVRRRVPARELLVVNVPGPARNPVTITSCVRTEAWEVDHDQGAVSAAGRWFPSVHGSPVRRGDDGLRRRGRAEVDPAGGRQTVGRDPKTFPIFLLHNVELPRKLGVSGSVGFHAAIPNPAFHGVTQTVAVASYLDAAVAPHEPDIAVLSHEVGEWMDDPLGTNSAPPWGNVGQVSGSCQRNLEVGDPLTGTTFAVAAGWSDLPPSGPRVPCLASGPVLRRAVKRLLLLQRQLRPRSAGLSARRGVAGALHSRSCHDPPPVKSGGP